MTHEGAGGLPPKMTTAKCEDARRMPGEEKKMEMAGMMNLNTGTYRISIARANE